MFEVLSLSLSLALFPRTFRTFTYLALADDVRLSPFISNDENQSKCQPNHEIILWMESMNHFYGKLNESSNFSVRFILWIRSGIAKNVKMLHAIEGVAPKFKKRRQDIWCAMKIEITMLQHHSHRHTHTEKRSKCKHISLIGIVNPVKNVSRSLNWSFFFHIGPCICVRVCVSDKSTWQKW